MIVMSVKIDLFFVYEFVFYKLFKLNLFLEIVFVFFFLIVVMVKILYDYFWV